MLTLESKDIAKIVRMDRGREANKTRLDWPRCRDFESPQTGHSSCRVIASDAYPHPIEKTVITTMAAMACSQKRSIYTRLWKKLGPVPRQCQKLRKSHTFARSQPHFFTACTRG
jgi:hypothetical protein